MHLWINYLWDIWSNVDQDSLYYEYAQVSSALLFPSKVFPCDYTQICTFSQSFVHCFTVFRWVEIFCWWDHKSWGMGKELHSSVPGFLFCSKMRVLEKACQMLPVCSISYLGMLWLHSYQGGLSPLSIWWGTLFSVFAGDAFAAVLHLLILHHGIWQHCEISNLIVWIHTSDSKTAVIDQSWVKGLKVLTLLLIKPLVSGTLPRSSNVMKPKSLTYSIRGCEHGEM